MNEESASRRIDFTRFDLLRIGIASSRLATLALLVSGMGLCARAATLFTDKPDYMPGEHVVFSGLGWQPGETITIDIYETSVDPIFWEGTVSATAGLDGSFSNGDLLVQESFLGQGFMA